MGYTTRDLAWYAAFIAGCSLTYVALGAAGVEGHIVKLLVAVAVGVGLGLGAQRLVPKANELPKSDEDREDRGE